MTAEKMKELFENEGWNNVNFEEITKKEAEEKGLFFAILGIKKGKKYFRMVGNGNIYNEHGEIAMFNIGVK